MLWWCHLFIYDCKISLLGRIYRVVQMLLQSSHTPLNQHINTSRYRIEQVDTPISHTSQSHTGTSKLNSANQTVNLKTSNYAFSNTSPHHVPLRSPPPHRTPSLCTKPRLHSPTSMARRRPGQKSDENGLSVRRFPSVLLPWCLLTIIRFFPSYAIILGWPLGAAAFCNGRM
jgi:hypothetical protein